MLKQNTPALWDEVWKDRPSKNEDLFNLVKEENGIRWQRIESVVLKKFGSFKNLKVIEIGAGAGTNAALMAKRGAKVSVLDNSEKALQRSKNFFQRNKLKAKFIKQDALNLPRNLFGKYDISMSFGLTEHFKGEERIKINKAHFDLLKKGGLAFISVPNKYNIPYQIYKTLAQFLGFWRVGEEYPYSRAELTAVCKKIAIKDYFFFGDSLWYSLNFISPIPVIKKLLKIKEIPDISKVKKEAGTFLDQYFSYALVLCGEK